MTMEFCTGEHLASKQHAIYIIVALTIALTLAGCGNHNPTTTLTTTTMVPIPGTVLDLDAMSFAGGPRLLITVNPVDQDGIDLPKQRLLLDTGSSTLAFCNTTFALVVKPLKIHFISCNAYGGGQSESGYWGYFYQGGVQISGGAIQVPNAYYSIMQQEVSMPCKEGINGIFGIAFQQLDMAAPSDDLPNWPEHEVGDCPASTKNFNQSLMQYLNSKGGVEQLGIYWSGKEGPNEGKLYLDEGATTNPYYDEAKANAIGKARLGEYGWYDIYVQSVEYEDISHTDITCDPDAGQPCIMDTGTPVLLIPEDVFNQMSVQKAGVLKINLVGKDKSSPPVCLKFDVKILFENNWVASTPTPGVILGLPLRAFYYTVMDITDRSVAFVPMESHLRQKLGPRVDISETKVVI